MKKILYFIFLGVFFLISVGLFLGCSPKASVNRQSRPLYPHEIPTQNFSYLGLFMHSEQPMYCDYSASGEGAGMRICPVLNGKRDLDKIISFYLNDHPAIPGPGHDIRPGILTVEAMEKHQLDAMNRSGYTLVSGPKLFELFATEYRYEKTEGALKLVRIASVLKVGPKVYGVYVSCRAEDAPAFLEYANKLFQTIKPLP